ncbi:hypothetical protein GCM10028785_34870 [Hydrogenophaga soli]
MQPAWAALTVNANGTVTDTTTGLVWDQCPYGQTGATCAGSAQTVQWQGALDASVAANAANYKGFSDWRVPNVKELLSIVKIDAALPSIDTTVFPNTPSVYFWTSTTEMNAPSQAWTVQFRDGLALPQPKVFIMLRPVRLVRSGQALASFDFAALPTQTITGFNPASPVVFGDAPATLSATGGASGNPVVFATTSAATVCTVSGSTVTYTGAGTCNLTANQAGNASFSAAPEVTASVVINPANQAITGFNPASPVVFGDAPATLSATGGASGNPVVFATTSAASVCTVSGNTVTFTGGGTCNLTANQGGNANHNAAPQVTASILVNPANQAITGFNPASPVVFGAAPATLSATGGASGNPVVFATTSAASVCTVSGNTVTFTGGGTCNLTANQAGNASYNAAPQVTASIVINPANQAITGFNPASPVVFGAAPATLSATGGASGNPVVFATTSAATVCTVSGNTVTFTGAGTCNLTANQAGNANYNAAPQVSASVVINPANQAITGFNPASPVVFGDAPATLSATGGASGNPVVFATTSAASVCTVSGNTVTFTGSGTCNLTANQAGNANYNAAPQVTASILINLRTSYSYAVPGLGTVTASFLGGSPTCGLASATYSVSPSPPSGVSMPYGLLTLSSTDCGAGAMLNFTVTLPQPLPAGAKFYAYGPEFGGSATPHWYELPGVVIVGNQVTFSITDNGQGDANAASGFITSAGGLGLLPSAVSGVPTLSQWTLLLLAGLLGVLGLHPRSRAKKLPKT